jgi:nicotinamidase-related amidase
MLQVSRSPQLAGNLGAQMPRFPQSAGNSPQRAGNLPAFEWKGIRTPLETRSAVQRNDLRSWLERFPQWAGNIPRINSILSIVFVLL